MPHPVVPPQPFGDLDWSPERGRAFAEEILELWEELLRRLPGLPVSGRWREEEVAGRFPSDIPDRLATHALIINTFRERSVATSRSANIGSLSCR